MEEQNEDKANPDVDHNWWFNNGWMSASERPSGLIVSRAVGSRSFLNSGFKLMYIQGLAQAGQGDVAAALNEGYLVTP